MSLRLYISWYINTFGPRQNGHHFADDTFKRIFVNENVRISIKIYLKFVPKGSINNITALVQIMTWCRAGDKPLSEPKMVRCPTHISVTRPRWIRPGIIHGRRADTRLIEVNIAPVSNVLSSVYLPMMLHYSFAYTIHRNYSQWLIMNMITSRSG